MIENPDSKVIERAEKEYDHVVSEMARYDSDSQKIISFISLLITTAFVIGFEKDIDLIFILVPIIALLIVQYMLSNNYAYRVREAYAHKLEKIIQVKGTDIPGLYGTQIRKHYLDLSGIGLLLLPFTGSILYAVLLVVLISAFSLFKACDFLNSNCHSLVSITYLTIMILMGLYTCLTVWWSSKRLSSEYKESHNQNIEPTWTTPV